MFSREYVNSTFVLAPGTTRLLFGLPDKRRVRLWNTFPLNWCIVSLWRKGFMKVCSTLHSGASIWCVGYHVNCVYSTISDSLCFGSQHAPYRDGGFGVFDEFGLAEL